MAIWSNGDVTLRAERSSKDEAVHVGAETPYGSGFASLRTGRRELLRAVGGVVFALLGLRRGVKRWKRQMRRTGRGGTRKTHR